EFLRTRPYFMPHLKPDRCLFTAATRSRHGIGAAVLCAALLAVAAIVCQRTDFAGADECTSVAEVTEQHWSFRPVVEPVVPEGDVAWGTSPVDRFIRLKLER